MPGPILKWNNAGVDLESIVGSIVDVGLPRFTVTSNGGIVDPAGNAFVPVGLNVNGANWVWPDPTIGVSGMMDVWGFNTVRVNSLIHAGDILGAPVFHNNDDLVAIVEEYTLRKCVVILANHTYGTTTGIDPAAGTNIADLSAWWQDTAAQFADNPYVWFNPCNEPTSGPEAYPSPDYGLDKWLNISTQLADAINEVAPDSMLVFDGHAAGQDKGHPSCRNSPDFTWPPFVYSALHRIPQLQARYGINRVILSCHFYGQWAGIGSPVAGCAGPTGDPLQYFRADANYYLDTLRDLGIPMVIGEFGCRENDDEEWFMSGNKEAAHMLVEDVLPTRTNPPPGCLFWHGSGGDLRYLEVTRNEWSSWDGDTGKLNRQGIAFYNYCQSVNP